MMRRILQLELGEEEGEEEHEGYDKAASAVDGFYHHKHVLLNTSSSARRHKDLELSSPATGSRSL